MRVAFVGNVANVHFRLARLLRERTALDAHLYVSDSDAVAWRPEADDPALADGYPDWIHAGDWVTPASLARPSSAPLTAALAEADLVVATGVGPVFAAASGRPWCFFVTGGDLTVKPFPLTFWRWYPTWGRRLAQVGAGARQRAAIRRADAVLSQPFAPMATALDRLGVDDHRRSDAYFPLPVDTERFSPDGPAWDVGPSDFVVFHPSRLVLDDSPRMRRTGQWKGNDTLLRAFAALAHSGAAAEPRLVLIDQPASRDRDLARSIVDELGIADLVQWLTPPDGEHFTQPEMAALYRRADVVCDEFGVGWFGYVTLEAAACGRPIVSHVDEAVMGQLYPWHPIRSALAVDDVATALIDLAADPGARRAAGERSREWAVRFHGAEAVTDQYVAAFRDLTGRLVPVTS